MAFGDAAEPLVFFFFFFKHHHPAVVLAVEMPRWSMAACRPNVIVK